MPPDAQKATAQPAAAIPWVILSQTDGKVVLGIDDDDLERYIVEPRAARLSVVCPCGACGWAETCEEGCHS